MASFTINPAPLYSNVCEEENCPHHKLLSLERNTTKVPVSVWFILLAAYIIMSSFAPAFQVLNPILLVASVWRYGIAFLLISVLRCDCLGFWLHKIFQRKEVFTSAFTMSLACSVWVYTFAFALKYTSIAHACVLTYFQSILLVIYRFFCRSPVSKQELAGVCLAFAGGILCAIDSSFNTVSSEEIPILGDILAFSGAFAGAVYLSYGKKLAKEDPDFPAGAQIWLVTLVAFVAAAVMLGILTQSTVHSLWQQLFGVMLHTETLCLTIYLAVGTIYAYYGYVHSLKFVQPLVVSLVCNMESVGATCFGVIFGTSIVRSPLTYCGMSFIIIGCWIVFIYGTQNTSEIDNQPNKHFTHFSQAT